MKSKIFSVRIFKDNMKRQIWILAILGLVYFFCYPLGILMSFSQWKQMKMGYNEIEEALIRYFSQDMSYVQLIVIVLGAVMAGVAAFSYLHSRQKVDFYHSLPVKRECMMGSQIAASFLLWFIPYVVSVFLAVCIGASNGHFSMDILKAAAAFAGINILLFFLVYFCTVLAVLLTGNLLVGILGIIVILGYAPFFILLLYGQFMSFFPAFNGDSFSQGICDFVKNYLSPVTWYLNTCSGGRGYTAIAVLGAVIAILLLLVLCMWIYKMRSSESAGKAMAFRKAAVAIQFLLVIPVSMGCGLFFEGFFSNGSKQSILWWIFGLVFGLVLSHGVIETIYRSNYRKFFSDRKILLMAGGAVAVISFFFGVDPLHYSSYLPEETQIERIGIEAHSLNYNLSASGFAEKSSNGETSLVTTDGDSYISMKATRETYNWVKQIVEENKKNKWYDSSAMDKENASFLSLKYELENGRKLYRSYYVGQAELEEKILQATEEEQFRQEMYMNEEILAPYTKRIYFSSGENYEEVTDATNGSEQKQEEIQEVFSSLEKDIASAGRFTFEEDPVGILYLEGNLSTSGTRGYSTEWSTGYYIYPGFKNIMAILEEKEVHIPKSVTVSEISSITVYDYDEEGLAEETVYTDPDELEEILPSLIEQYRVVPWKNMDVSKTALIKLKDTNHGSDGIYCSIDRGKAPDFLEK